MVHRIPGDIRRFIIRNIDSIAEWEGLLLMRAGSQAEWEAKTIAAKLYIKEAEALKILTQLVTKGFIEHTQPGFYKYAPASADLEQMIASTAEIYPKYLVPITHLIHSKNESRIQQFADAFRIKKE